VSDHPPQDRPPDKDEIKPFHARDVSSGQETADVVAAVLKHAAERDVAAKKKTTPKPEPVWMLPMGLTLTVLAAFLLIAPPPWIVVNPIAAQAPEDQLTKLRASMWLYINKIETYRLTNGSLPQTLAEVGEEVEGLDYTVTGQNYSLYSSVGDQAVLFNSAVDSAREWGQREVGNLSQRIGG
jgi:hypothetical protein